MLTLHKILFLTKTPTTFFAARLHLYSYFLKLHNHSDSHSRRIVLRMQVLQICGGRNHLTNANVSPDVFSEFKSSTKSNLKCICRGAVIE